MANERTTDEGVRRRRAPRPSGRLRVVAWIVAVTGMGLTILVLGASFALRATSSNDLHTAWEQEAGELRRFSSAAVDPETGRRFTTAADFIDTYLKRQEPSATEIIGGASLVGTADGAAPTTRGGRLTPAFEELDSATKSLVVASGSSGTHSTLEHGRISWRNFEVRAPDGAGYLMVIEFHETEERELARQLGLLALLALASLVATGIVAWWVSGRILLPVDRFEQTTRTAARGPRPGEPPHTVARLPETGGDEDLRLARAANALLRAAERAIEAEQQFSDDLAQTVRTPLAIARGTLEQPGSTPEQIDVSRQRALGEIERLQGVVADLVVLNQADRTDFLNVVDNVDTATLVGDAVSRWNHAGFAGPGVVQTGEVQPIEMTTDPARVGRALDELIANAVTASSAGPVLVACQSGEGRDGEASRALLSVTDSGRGIPEGEHEIVQARFARASNDPAPGEGLGLTVATRIAHVLGGDLTLTPREGGGTLAVLELPLASDRVLR